MEPPDSDEPLSPAPRSAADPIGGTCAGRDAVDLDYLAHELRTPLAAIQSMADALASGHLGALEPRHAAYLGGIRDTARHALAVIERITEGNRPAPTDARQPTEPAGGVDLPSLAAEVSGGMAMLAARAGIRLETAVYRPLARARARGTDVRQMLINLISNSISHAGDGSTVVVTAGGDGEPEVWVEVRDDGRGIPRAVLDRLTKGSLLDAATDASLAPRTRLGLSLTRSLVEANGGRLEIVSGSQGTCVRISLPVASDR
ncbi:MAG: HAMP domain-containing sensor histidine kinase [Hyphomicrobiaceae bacterium]|nr:HAMP domain-containing sensor histidine kinase [Hyphomicrobiaceae bacterium]